MNTKQIDYCKELAYTLNFSRAVERKRWPSLCDRILHVIETVVLLRREKVDVHIEVDLDLDELEDKSGIYFGLSTRPF